ncbi:hypothetical protein CALVIDRAFT_323 [Calocera viscosa TUFC12733]|uniref:Uncharacterized protein n=1 Tax=Calocera viscosa (strain TUFC12733) TaxID=1330018 RepID=A0A167RYB8_CALVF|nr:hypothetical protein CALVIDRAFT_323 [Calocera viscosa TUFC12733]
MYLGNVLVGRSNKSGKRVRPKMDCGCIHVHVRAVVGLTLRAPLARPFISFRRLNATHQHPPAIVCRCPLFIPSHHLCQPPHLSFPSAVPRPSRQGPTASTLSSSPTARHRPNHGRKVPLGRVQARPDERVGAPEARRVERCSRAPDKPE